MTQDFDVICDDDSVGVARRWLDRKADDGAICPCCRGVVKVYSRKINATMALVLIEMARSTTVESGPVWLHVQRDVLSRLVSRGVHAATSGDYAKLRYWDLIVPIPTGRAMELRANSSGLWRITARGLMFVRRQIKVQSVARVLGGDVIGYAGLDVGIEECLGKRFSYDELVAGSKWLEPRPQPEQWRLI